MTLSARDYRVLSLILRRAGGATPSVIQRELGLGPNHAKTSTRALHAAGLIFRHGGYRSAWKPTDSARSKHPELTAGGGR